MIGRLYNWWIYRGLYNSPLWQYYDRVEKEANQRKKDLLNGLYDADVKMIVENLYEKSVIFKLFYKDLLK